MTEINKPESKPGKGPTSIIMRLDSESEGYDGQDSDSDDMVQIAKKALCVDQADIDSYDGISEPQNGSQYLLKVMEEARHTPKTVVADMKNVKRKSEGSNAVSLFGKYLSQYDQVGSSTV